MSHGDRILICGVGGSATGRVRSNSTLNKRPFGRESSYTNVRGCTSIAQVFSTDAFKPPRLNMAMDSASTGNACRSALPMPRVSPPYIVMSSGLPSW